MSGPRTARSLSLRMLIAQTAIALAICLVVLAGVYFDTRARLDQQLGLFATRLGANLSEDEAADVARSVEQSHTKNLSVDYAVGYRPDMLYQAYGPDHRLVTQSDAALASPLLPLGAILVSPIPPADAPARTVSRAIPSAITNTPGLVPVPGCDAIEYGNIEIDGAPWRAVRVRSGACYETQAAESMQWRRDAALAALRPFVVRMSWILPLVILATWLVAQYTMRPLRQLARVVALRSPTSLDRVQTTPEYAETVPLIDEINRLISQLRRLLAIERESFADAAHELLTPIAVIEAQAHLLSTAKGAEARGRATADLHQGLARTAQLIRQLLLLARVGSDAADNIALIEGNLSAVLQERVAQMAARALAKGIDVELEAPRECRCSFDRDTLMSAVDNLLDNAIRYGASGGRILVSLCDTERAAELIVADDGPGIPLGYRERVTERFFRVPGTTEPGSGLGLAIVQCIVQLHHGTFTLRSGVGGQGLAACISLPRAYRASNP
jgi:two-component system sensor histidine kinase QseC